MTSRRGMFGQPGQREYVEGGTGRILTTVKWMSLWGLGILFLLFVDALILGPWAGWLIGLLIILYMSKPICLWMIAQGFYARLVACSIMVSILLFYAIVGYPAFEREWPPYHPLPIPLWMDIGILAISLVLKAFLGWGIWGMWAELIDPGGPTAPRVAVPRDTLILPWGKYKETYGGARLPPRNGEQTVLPPLYRRIQLVLVDEGNHVMEFADIEDSPRTIKLAKAIRAGDSFSERTAGECGFSRGEWKKEIRDPFLNRGWADWEDEEHHEQGVRLTTQGYDFWTEIAEGNYED